jgi:hypothetical protein
MSASHLPRPPGAKATPPPKLVMTQIVSDLELYVGPHPTRIVRSKDADVLCLVAHEHQDRDDVASPKVVVRSAPLRDNAGAIEPLIVGPAMAVATFAAHDLADGKRVLITCNRGLNRAPFVAGLTLMNLFAASAGDIVEAIRLALGKDALSNASMVATLSRYVGSWRERRRAEADGQK